MARMVDPSGRPFSGLVPHTVIALVTDNKGDPDKLGRIKVKFPTLETEPESYWLRQATPNASKEFGLWALPEVGDEVLVLFTFGSQDVGIIIGQLWNGVDKPPQEAWAGMPGSGSTWGSTFSDTFSDGSTNIDANDRRFWKSRSGHLFVFDDTSGAETIQIWDNSHKLALVFDTAASLILLSNSEGDINIRAKNDIIIEAGNDFKFYAKNNFEGETKMDTKWKVGNNTKWETKLNEEHKSTQYKNEASAKWEAKGAMSKLEGSGKLDCTSPMSTFEGSGMCMVKGGLVKLN
jgi:uncharacterized protein involved in type VI secretion and phage assembly